MAAPKKRAEKPPVDDRVADEKPFRVYHQKSFGADPVLLHGCDSQQEADDYARGYRGSTDAPGRVYVEGA